MLKTASMVLGVVLLLVGLLGFIPNGLVGEGAAFQTDLLHNLVHLLTGAILLLLGKSPELSKWLKILGVVYALLAVLGFLGGDMILGFISTGGGSNWLHLVLAVVFLGLPRMAKGGSAPMTTPVGGGMPGQM